MTLNYFYQLSINSEQRTRCSTARRPVERKWISVTRSDNSQPECAGDKQRRQRSTDKQRRQTQFLMMLATVKDTLSTRNYSLLLRKLNLNKSRPDGGPRLSSSATLSPLPTWYFDGSAGVEKGKAGRTWHIIFHKRYTYDDISVEIFTWKRKGQQHSRSASGELWNLVEDGRKNCSFCENWQLLGKLG